MSEAPTKFEAWVKRYTPSQLVTQLTNRGAATRCSLGMVYAWTRGEHEPRTAKRTAIIELAAGELTLEDIAAHFAAKNQK
jgi:hypothetical protein